MSSAFRTRERHVIALGGGAIALVLFATRVAPALMAWSANERASAGLLATELNRAVASVRGLRVTRESLVARRVRLAAVELGVLEGDSPPLAAAALAERIADAAERAKARIASVEMHGDTVVRGGFTSVSARVAISGDLASVVRCLAELEAGATLLAIREVVLSPQEAQPAPGQVELIHAQFVIEGLARDRRRTGEGNQ